MVRDLNPLFFMVRDFLIARLKPDCSREDRTIADITTPFGRDLGSSSRCEAQSESAFLKGADFSKTNEISKMGDFSSEERAVTASNSP